jgi:hypothetical protein
MSTRFEIQEFTLFDGWINTWLSVDNDGEAYKTTFDTRSEAQLELESFIHDMQKAVADGYMEDVPSIDSYKIVEV